MGRQTKKSVLKSLFFLVVEPPRGAGPGWVVLNQIKFLYGIILMGIYFNNAFYYFEGD